ncbi:hypothetical protein Rsub_04351 [Raphidocelis subcapitata]|uniref:non-specific serine/threonine protein kinase n=1 Tax=Raphidocelis subcapitata TaxID=307507 RepID=A0A2V0NVG2_9CHLO|nr:hypothetical protein Rsub_04351 [Raphidocelis subcapitata]|eukprot:GBF91611.1 hypothetical protein Rsub_04351 [Raphidocelis subcapitata]
MYRAVSNQVQAQPPAQPKFKVLKALGRGSYGTVYKVQRLADGQVYAMKETDIGKMSQQERNDAVNEIRVLGSLSHPNVVRQYETFMAGNKLCIVMELAPAGDLSGFIRAAAASGRPLPEGTVWQVFLQLCQGMQAVHDTCVIHRDIKPANIFMCPDNTVKVGDLGVAKALTRAHYAQTQIGTPIYMAPEVWRGLPYGYSSDLWSLGCVLYELMSYRVPFDGRSINELKVKIIGGRFPPLAPGTYSAPLVGLAHALLSRDPRQRPTCAAILNSPEAAAWMHTVPAPVRLPPPPVNGGGGLHGAGGGGGGALMPTIRVPKDIRLLPGVLPKPTYDATLRAAMIGRGGAGLGAPLAPVPQNAPLAAPPPPVPAVYGGAPAARAPTPPAGGARPPSPGGAMRPPSPPGRAAAGGGGAIPGLRPPSPRGAAAPAGGGVRPPSPGGFRAPSPAAARGPSPLPGAAPGAARAPSPFGGRAPSPRGAGAPPLAPQPPAGARAAGAARPNSGARVLAHAAGAAAGVRAAAGQQRPAAGVLPGGAAAVAAAATAYRPGGGYYGVAPKAPAPAPRAAGLAYPLGPSPRGGGRPFY